MSSSPQLTLYKKVVDITTEYIGPAADRFVARQIRSHLNKPPEQLKKQDLVRLIDWIGLAMALITEDEKVLSEYVEDLRYMARHEKG